jgi:N-methylhydantoinase A
MNVRVGVDVGGTFTKAIACNAGTGEIFARAIVPTTHRSTMGVAGGVADAVGTVTSDVARAGLGPVSLVAHSTTQAVNALLEGDAATVGVLGIGRRPDLKRARKRTQVGAIGLAPGCELKTLHAFLDASQGITRREISWALSELVEAGAGAVCVSEAFGVDDSSAESLGLEVAREMDVPACGGHELSGLYGLELRTVTGAINASILPAAIRTARIVQDSVPPDIPLLVMRGDGGAADLRLMQRHPLLTAFSGPAASVAGALRYLDVVDGVVVEVGGTSTNISCVKGGRPVLAYVRVLDHVTCVRSIDVRVVGVAGGSLVRIEPRRRHYRIAGIGPRSAHIAGLEYCSFVSEERLIDVRLTCIAPVDGDPRSYAVVENRAGERFALTPTCAANALGVVPADAYAKGSETSARRGFEALAASLGCRGEEAARRTLDAAAASIGAAVAETAAEAKLADLEIIGVGGGAGALVPAIASALDGRWRIPRDAEVISSVGDALSLVRAEIERSLVRPSPDQIQQLHRDAEFAAMAAGASPASVRVESVAVPERNALRVVATGSVALESGAGGGRGVTGEQRAGDESVRLAAKSALGGDPTLVSDNGFYRVFSAAPDRWAIIDRHGSVAGKGSGRVLVGTGAEVEVRLNDAIRADVRHIGPMSIAPAVRILRGPRLVDLSILSSAESALEAAVAECRMANGEGVVAFLSRS